MKILIDTNIILDVILNRKPYAEDAVKLLKIPEKKVQKFISASSVTDIFYIASREFKDKTLAIKLIKKLLKVIRIANVSENEIISALNSGWADFEDSVQNAVAESNSVDMIITRNQKDYSNSKLPVKSAAEFFQES